MATQHFQIPPISVKDNGETRQVGFELEFTGLTLDQAMSALRSVLDGELTLVSQLEQKLEVEQFGSFIIELDWDFLKRKAVELQQKNKSGDWIDLLEQAAYDSQLIPIELVCPPIPIHQIELLQPLVSALQQAGAVGTADSPLAAFGVHINAEIPNLHADTILRYLQAFGLLQWWLVQHLEVDLSRRISPFIDLYPHAYVKHILACSEVTIDQIFDDYLEHNPSRNRALDMLPMLAHINMQRVQARVQDVKIKPRPTFHYRLPNSQIDRKDWSLATAWNSWWLVEQLAAQPPLLDELIQAYFAAQRPVIGISRKTWVEFIDSWLKDHAWV